jgi:hypothetical protein
LVLGGHHLWCPPSQSPVPLTRSREPCRGLAFKPRQERVGEGVGAGAAVRRGWGAPQGPCVCPRSPRHRHAQLCPQGQGLLDRVHLAVQQHDLRLGGTGQ